MSDSANAAFVEVWKNKALIKDFWRFELVAFRKGSTELMVDHRPELGHLPGLFQGTVITGIAEFAGGLASISSLPEGRMTTTVDQTIKFIGQARGDRLIARGRVIKPSLSLVACAVDIFVRRDGEEHLIATMLQSNFVLPE
jgi:acyl-coenzyme A thioesterase PaaI-like protein